MAKAIRITYCGMEKTLHQWSKIIGNSAKDMADQLTQGFKPEQALIFGASNEGLANLAEYVGENAKDHMNKNKNTQKGDNNMSEETQNTEEIVAANVETAETAETEAAEIAATPETQEEVVETATTTEETAEFEGEPEEDEFEEAPEQPEEVVDASPEEDTDEDDDEEFDTDLSQPATVPAVAVKGKGQVKGKGTVKGKGKSKSKAKKAKAKAEGTGKRRGKKSENPDDKIIMDFESCLVENAPEKEKYAGVVTLIRKKSTQVLAFQGPVEDYLAICEYDEKTDRYNVTEEAEETLKDITLTAKPYLRQINIEHDLGVETKNADGKDINSRQLGKKIIDRLAPEEEEEEVIETEEVEVTDTEVETEEAEVTETEEVEAEVTEA